MKIKALYLATVISGLMPLAGTAQADVRFDIIESNHGGVETTQALWNGVDVGITVTPTGPETWFIDLSASGHATFGGGDFPNFGNNGVMTWFEPTPGLFNNLYFVNDFLWRLESESPVPANINNDGIYGIFADGVSIFAGRDRNAEPVFVAVSERVAPVPVPAAAWLFGSALAGFFGFARHRKMSVLSA